jgi:ABC-type nitrate/sulfonate/bicarbonate transport system substrate-binding protein
MSLHKKRNLVVLAAVILIVAIILSSFVYLNSQKPFTGKMESISVAYSPFESLTLFFVAQEQGYFVQNGLNVTSHKYATGSAALNGLVNNEEDIVVGTSEFPFTASILNGNRISTITSISKSEFIYLIGRGDRGIHEVSDLKNKTIGVAFGTIAQFYLGRFLNLNGLNLQDVSLVNLKTSVEWVNAVVNGSVDAVATAQPSANLAEAALGNNRVIWSIQSNQPLYAEVITSNEWIINHPELVNRFLKSLSQAEDFTINHPADEKTIVKNELNLTDAYAATVWRQNQFHLSLDQSLLLAMQDEARWLINNNLSNSTSIPNFVNYVYVDGLKSVRPDSVNIIGLEK